MAASAEAPVDKDANRARGGLEDGLVDATNLRVVHLHAAVDGLVHVEGDNNEGGVAVLADGEDVLVQGGIRREGSEALGGDTTGALFIAHEGVGDGVGLGLEAAEGGDVLVVMVDP